MTQMTEKKKPLIILTGPTAVGKTAASIGLAKAIGGEIISADSMQVYKYMDIGSAKIRPEEMQGVKHYLVDVLEPEEEFHIVKFQQMAKEAMKKIYAAGHIPIVVGGTGFYIQAVLYDIAFSEEETDSALRRQLEEEAAQKGNAYMHEKLAAVDPESAAAIHENNSKRVIRAIEYYMQTGEKISVHNAREHEKESPYAFCYFVLNDDRKKLYDRIDARVDQMVEEGLYEEVKGLLADGIPRSATSMQALGYKEMADHICGDCPLEEAIYLIKRDTRHFAKRQITWFKREKDVTWMNYPDYNNSQAEMLDAMLKMIKERGIIKR